MSERKLNQDVVRVPVGKPEEFEPTTHAPDVRAQIEAYIHDARDYAQLLIDASVDMIISTDITLRIIEFNPAAEKSFGYTRDEVIGESVDILYAEPGDAWPIRIDTFRNTANTEVLNRRKNGEVFVASLRSVRLCNHEGETIGVMGISREITAERMIEQELHEKSLVLATVNRELEVANDRLQHLASTDELTGLPNRRAIMDHLNVCWSRAQRDNSSVSCVIFDIDKFKLINDTYGHDIGDEALRSVAETIRNATRSSEMVGRIGGEEFLLVFSGGTAEEVYQGAERVRTSVATTSIAVRGERITVTMSAGLSTMNQQTNSVYELLKLADTALYIAKEKGRNRLELADGTPTSA
ncbi:MAG: hypothetical protein DHS20C16_25080 [Phycisphaerae bacterium]|nr:MAG: hypothetical protein DHS20C16_25080 [Phycisphaerae bacterium]